MSSIPINTSELIMPQVKGDILSEAIFCPAEKAVLLASYATQVNHFNKFGTDPNSRKGAAI